MVPIQSQCFVELAGFSDLARYVCALREYPLRAYSHMYGTTRVISSAMELANTLLIFYVPMKRTGRYISYKVSARKETCKIADSTGDISLYAPIINFDSAMSPLKTKARGHADRFHPVRMADIGSLARLTYDPEFPDEINPAMFAFEHKRSWVLGYITTLDMDDTIYQFNYAQLESEPAKPFLKYRGNKGQSPEFADRFVHGFTYMPIIKLKKEHLIFGMGRR